jgi:hypothetical protein
MEKVGGKNSNNFLEEVIISTRIRKVRDIEDNAMILGGYPNITR